jgi:hypothetical protein
MRSLSLAFAAASVLYAGSALAQTTSPSDCTSLWKQADASAGGALTQTQAKPYVTDFNSVDTDKDGKITNAEFMKGCSAGHVRKTAASGSSGSTGTGTGTSGSR